MSTPPRPDTPPGAIPRTMSSAQWSAQKTIESRDVMTNVALSFIQDSLLDSRSAGRSPDCASFACRGGPPGYGLLRLKLENVARLARERFADRIERREADRARLAGLENR